MTAVAIAALCQNYQMAARHRRPRAGSEVAAGSGEGSDLSVPAGDRNDWRVSVYLRVPGAALQARRALSVYEVENELRQRVPVRVRPRTDGRDIVFLYTRTQEVAVAAQQVASDLLAQHGMPAQIVIERWQPAAGQWVLPDVLGPFA